MIIYAYYGIYMCIIMYMYVYVTFILCHFLSVIFQSLQLHNNVECVDWRHIYLRFWLYYKVFSP